MEKDKTIEDMSKVIESLDNAEFITQVVRGMDNQEFQLFFQPILSTKTQEIKIIEALVYWEHPVYGNLCSADFSKKIQTCALCVPFGVHILRLFSETIAYLKKKICKDIQFSINLSTRQLISEGFGEFLCKSLRMFNNHFEDVMIEITDNHAIDDIDKLETIIRDLSAQDISFALGKYDTTHTTFEYMNRFPLSAVKIDQTFLPDTVDQDGYTVGSLFESIVGLCKSKNVVTIAEGIDDTMKGPWVQHLGVSLMQGHAFHKPMSITSLVDMFCTHDHDQELRGY